MQSSPQISICIPSYRRKDQLLTLIESIRFDAPILVSDNEGYMRGTENLDHRVRLVGKPDVLLPMFENWNNAVREVETEYFLIPSDDDIYYEQAFEVVKRTMERFPGRDTYIFGNHFVDESYSVIGQWTPGELADYPRGEGFMPFKYGVNCRMPSVVIRKSKFDEAGGFNRKLKITAADSELIQKLLLTGTSVYVPEIISGYRIWTSSLTSSTNATAQWFDEVELWCRNIERMARDELGPRFLPRDFRFRIIYENFLSACYTVKKRQGIGRALRFAAGKAPYMLRQLASVVHRG